ncbi:MAG: hypothetical protein Q8O89_00415 [Nanoarchaeota archaeon]|nr:hypothetical protein [Nanoarchaeota archaeon]
MEHLCDIVNNEIKLPQEFVDEIKERSGINRVIFYANVFQREGHEYLDLAIMNCQSSLNTLRRSKEERAKLTEIRKSNILPLPELRGYALYDQVQLHFNELNQRIVEVWPAGHYVPPKKATLTAPINTNPSKFANTFYAQPPDSVFQP